MNSAFPFRHFNPPFPNPKLIQYRRQPVSLPISSTPTDLPSILSMRLSEWIDLLTHPISGAFPNGISPKQMDQLANNQVTRSSLEHGIEFRPLWKTSNHLGVLLWNEVKAGRIYRLHKACYVGKIYKKLQTQMENSNAQGKQVLQSIGYVQPSFGQDCGKSPSLADSVGMGKFVPKSYQVCHPVSIVEKESRTIMETKPNLEEFRCFVCKKDNNDGQDVGLKCKGCSYQSHVKCSYTSGLLPVSLLNKTSVAVLNWRCYDCKCCHLCSDKNAAADDLLLCDGCDSGEHMGCQNPPISTIPPAPWYCSICRNEMAPRESQIDKAVSPKHDAPAELTTDDQSESPPKLDSFHTDTQQSTEDNVCTLEPSTQSAWVAVLNTDTPPMSEGNVDSPLNQSITEMTSAGQTISCENKTDATTIAAEKPKPIKIRLGKRPHSSVWQRSESLESEGQPEKRNSTPRRASIPVGRGRGIPDTEVPNIQSQERRESNHETSASPTATDGLPSLTNIETADIRGAKFWTVEQTANFFTQMGFPDSAEAFGREEIDGPALLLLQRQDVLHNLGVRLGPALKTYKLVRFIQNNARPHDQ